MRKVFGLSSRLVLSTLLGISLTTWLSLGPVNAQAKMKKDKSASKEKMMKKEAVMSDDHMMKDHMMMSDDDEILPLAPSYPSAPPGALDLYHWTDYTKKHMKAGSAMNEKMDKMHDKMMKSGDNMMMSDEDVLPAAPSYPNAPPGGLDIYHWTDYTKKHMKAGSAMNEKMDKMHDKMMKSGDHMMMSDEEDILPLAPSYPSAPPGALDLYHWTDYTKKHMKAGSAMNEKMDKMKMKNEKMMKK